MAAFALELAPLLSRACERCELAPGALSLRVGLHSGSVTAGVLRADRSRFQLFGDTVNTASRMESTGEAGRIQCSAAAAELLRAGGFSLELRGKVECKGKGLIDTFWLQPDARAATRRAAADVPDAGAFAAVL
jgi:class 3 adenylate cyclase